MKSLKMKSLKSLAFLIILFVVIGSFLFPRGLRSLLISFSKPQNLDTIDYSGDIEGMYVEGTLFGIYDWYCEEKEGAKLVSREYLIDAGENYYMGMMVMKKYNEQANALMEASYDYLDGVDDGTALEAAQYTVRGTIEKMPEDSLELYKEYLDWDNMAADEQATFLPYYLAVERIGGLDSASMWAFTGIGGVLYLISLWFIISIFTGRYQKSVKAYIAQSNNQDATREKVESFFSNTQRVNGLLLGRDYFSGQSGAKTIFIESSKLAWVYQMTTTHKRNFVTVGHSYSIKVGFTDGNIVEFSMKNEAAAQEMIEKISTTYPQVIAGYTDELNKLYQKDMTGFLNLRYNGVISEQQQMSV